MCEQKCGGEQKVYSGEIVVTEEMVATETGGTGGSAATLSVSAPLDIKVVCDAHGRDYSALYIVIAVIAIIVLVSLMGSGRKK